jgi:serine/threonine protein kinase
MCCGGWQLGAEIAAGAFGTVFRCQNTADETQPERAMKVARKARAVVGELLAEATRLRHRNVVTIEDVMAKSGRVFVRMELCEGPELFDFAGHLSDSGMLRVTKDLVSAVLYLHRWGLVHRDIKPENVVVAEHGERCVLIDLGSMRSEGAVAWPEGTPLYQPPEARSRVKPMVVERSLDDWSLGTTLAVVACGKEMHTPADCLSAAASCSRKRRPTTGVLLRHAAEMLRPKRTERLTARRLSSSLSAYYLFV